jgi:Ca2+/Na+ antiporter
MSERKKEHYPLTGFEKFMIVFCSIILIYILKVSIDSRWDFFSVCILFLLFLVFVRLIWYQNEMKKEEKRRQKIPAKKRVEV